MSLIEIMSVMNRPQRDEAIMQKAGIQLDRALFPLLVGIERLGPLGIVDLADRAGRDHTTVSRQVTKLESLGLVERVKSASDRRLSQLTVTDQGKAMTDHIDKARERMGQIVFESWDTKDVDDLVRLVSKFAGAIRDV
jgi:DNA-binding MarR family transcriptional regulator